jgi:hypothetical protein
MARRHCSEWKPLEGRFDQTLGLPLVAMKGESRGALLERARLLAADPAYPPPHVVNAVAELVARHVQV